MDVMVKLEEAINILDEIDKYHETLVDRLSELDLKQQDLLHYVEFNKINILWCYNMLKQLKAIRIERRKIKNDMSLLQKFNDIKNRFCTTSFHIGATIHYSINSTIHNSTTAHGARLNSNV